MPGSYIGSAKPERNIQRAPKQGSGRIVHFQTHVFLAQGNNNDSQLAETEE